MCGFSKVPRGGGRGLAWDDEVVVARLGSDDDDVGPLLLGVVEEEEGDGESGLVDEFAVAASPGFGAKGGGLGGLGLGFGWLGSGSGSWLGFSEGVSPASAVLEPLPDAFEGEGGDSSIVRWGVSFEPGRVVMVFLFMALLGFVSPENSDDCLR